MHSYLCINTHTHELTHKHARATKNSSSSRNCFQLSSNAIITWKDVRAILSPSKWQFSSNYLHSKEETASQKASYILSKRSSDLCWKSSRNDKYYRSQKLHKASWQEKTIGTLYVIVYRTSTKVVWGNVRNTNKSLEYRKNWCSFPNNTANICSLMIWK